MIRAEVLLLIGVECCLNFLRVAFIAIDNVGHRGVGTQRREVLGSVVEMSHLDLGTQCVFTFRFGLAKLGFREISVVHGLTLVVVSVAQND